MVFLAIFFCGWFQKNIPLRIEFGMLYCLHLHRTLWLVLNVHVIPVYSILK